MRRVWVGRSCSPWLSRKSSVEQLELKHIDAGATVTYPVETIAEGPYLQALLPDPGPFVARVRNSDFGRRLLAGTNPSVPASDLHLCAQADLFDFALRAEHSGGLLQLQRYRPCG